MSGEAGSTPVLSGAAQHLGALRERGEQGLHFTVSFAAVNEAKATEFNSPTIK